MKIKIGQLFARKTTGITAKNTYLVCGIIKTDEPLNTEATHILTADLLTVLESRDVSEYTRGNNIDGVMMQPLWKINIKDDEP